MRHNPNSKQTGRHTFAEWFSNTQLWRWYENEHVFIECTVASHEATLSIQTFFLEVGAGNKTFLIFRILANILPQKLILKEVTNKEILIIVKTLSEMFFVYFMF